MNCFFAAGWGSFVEGAGYAVFAGHRGCHDERSYWEWEDCCIERMGARIGRRSSLSGAHQDTIKSIAHDISLQSLMHAWWLGMGIVLNSDVGCMTIAVKL
jgi:hypothetical protein